MSARPGFTHTTLNEVFSRISNHAGPLPGMVVVTPNHRLASVLRQRFNHYQISQGRIVWGTADILPFAAFLERTYTDALFAGERAAALPDLLKEAHEQVLWEHIIGHSTAASPLLAVPETARLAREAWQLLHEWSAPEQAGALPADHDDREDCRVFRGWAQRYRRITQEKNQTDQARLCGQVIRLWKEQAADNRPQHLVCYGFDRITPQQHALFLELARHGCTLLQAGPEPRHGSVKRLVFAGRRDEIRHAAAWARAQVEGDQGTSRIGIVVPDLAGYRSDMVRLFSAVLEPRSQSFLPGVQRENLPFNISLGLPLSVFPLVTAALTILELAGGQSMDFELISALLRSPFLAGSETAMADRARLDAELRKSAGLTMTLEQLLVRIRRIRAPDSSDTGLVTALSALTVFHRTRLNRQHTPSLLAGFFPDILKLAGFPGEHTLDSVESQTLAKWHEVITDFAGLDRVITQTGYTEAIAIVRRMATGVLFQPETPDVPVQILGVLEAAGMEFDHLWVMGLSDEAWPLPAHPNPFLPLRWQRQAGLTRSSAEEAAGFARRLTAGWLTGAGEVVLSHARDGGQERDRKLMPSPLIQDIAATDMTLPDALAGSGLPDVCQTRQTEVIEDYRMPLLDQTAENIRGGARIIGNYAACPFRAQAMHRLGAVSLENPHNGLDARERGTLVHGMLAEVWSRLGNKKGLDTISPEALEIMLAESAGITVRTIHPDRLATLSAAFVQIEVQRLVRLAEEWLEQERGREDFSVIAIEDRRSIRIGGLTLQVQLDRVDESADGQRLVIDYKTGNVTANSMLGERPAEPQLPLYLVTAEPEAAAIAFARIRPGNMCFAGYQRDRELLPGAQCCKDPDSRESGNVDECAVLWQRQKETWHNDLTALAAGFVAGKADVDPQQYPHTCRHCDLQPFCRIYARAGSSLEEEQEEDSE